MGNQCSKGIFKRKKSDRIEVQELEEWDHHTVPVSFTLPSKLWKVVLIHANAQNPENVSVRHVKKKELLTKYKRISLKSSTSSPILTFSPDDIQMSDELYASTRYLVLDIATSDPSGPPNRQPPYNIVYKKFSQIVKIFGEKIYALKYSVRNDVPESIEGLRNIFDMKNLQVLTMHCQNWSQVNILNGLLHFKNELDEKILSDQNGGLVSLEGLQILGGNGFLPLNYLFSKIAKEIKYLHLSFKDDSDNPQSQEQCDESLKYSIFELFPNVRALKVYEVKEDIFFKILPVLMAGEQNEMHLEHLSIKLQLPYVLTLNMLCKAMDKHCAETIKFLQLKSSQKPSQNAFEAEDDNVIDIDPTVKLEKLKELNIFYDLLIKYPEFVLKIIQKSPNLKTIIFFLFDDDLENIPNLETICRSLWCKLPTVMDRVLVKYFLSGELIRENVPGPNPAEPVSREKLIVARWLQLSFPVDDGGTGGTSDKIISSFQVNMLRPGLEMAH